MSAPLAIDLEQALPVELTGSTHNWFTGYRRYPVFSRPWARGRLRLVGTSLGLFFLAMAPLLLADDPRERPWSTVGTLFVSLVVPALLGPWLGGRIRRRGLASATEFRALAAAMLAVAAATTAFHLWGEEPLKQGIAAAAGQLDERGQRPKVSVAVGISARGGSWDEEMQRVRGSTINASVNVALRAVLAFLLAGGLGLRGWRRETEGLAALERERALKQAQAARREAELRLSVLAAQVEPHFLFNTLAGVRSAIHSDPQRASEMIDRLVDYLRASIPRLRSDGSAQATVAAQFELVRAYLALMSARMPRLQFTLDLPSELRQARCPPLMLISLAENAVKHGVELKIGPCLVELRAERTADGDLALSVLDDGVGFGASQAGTGLGLTNIRERLAQLYPGRASLSLKSRPEGGVAATITLPLELTADAA